MKWLSEYQRFVEETTSPVIKTSENDDLRLSWALSGMAAEAGEVMGVYEKSLRKHGRVLPEFEASLIDELGDTLYFLTAVANELGYDLHEVMALNVYKIEKRIFDAKSA